MGNLTAKNLLVMNKLFIGLFLLFFSCSIIQREGLREFKWKNRVLIIVNSDKKTSKKIKRDYLQEFKDRDLILITVVGDEVFLNDKLTAKSLSQSVLLITKESIHGNGLILIGKDGEVKKRYNSENEINLILQDIDSMPMRIREMKK